MARKLAVPAKDHWREKLKGLSKKEARLMRERHRNFQDWCAVNLHPIPRKAA